MTRWSVWCEHADGRCYRMGDASETRWSQATAEGVAKHMTAYEVGTFVAQPCPSPTDFESAIAALVPWLRLDVALPHAPCEHFNLGVDLHSVHDVLLHASHFRIV